ncbi:hypothetical protein CU044_4731 [Streptomyces sp. L-9-10]|nr:hypothetical protein CU044_4731 [Streptomyces sp. L-9-10]
MRLRRAWCACGAGPGRTLTVCRLDVFGVREGRSKLIAAGRQTLIRVDGAVRGGGR